MKMEVPKRIVKVRQLIDDLNEVELWNSKIKMIMIWKIVQFPQILTSWVSPFVISQIRATFPSPNDKMVSIKFD